MIWFVNAKINIGLRVTGKRPDGYHNLETLFYPVGIYAGTGFNDKQLAPTPYIIEKTIDEQTDAQGKLKVMIKVKANQ